MDPAQPPALPAARRVVTMFSDIEGSTRLWEQRAAEMSAALGRHDALAQALVQRHGGQLVKTTGDGIHAAFDDPAAALAAALDLQLGLSSPTAEGAEAPPQGLALRVRCGLHIGPAEARGGDYYGSSVNRAARIMSIAHGGQTLVSAALAAAVAGRMPGQASLRELGRVRLRDLSEPEDVLQLEHPGLRDKFPVLRSLEATPNNLAQQLDSFVGREAEFATARRMLAESRLVTLLGMGGLGKSRLSVQLGAELLPEFADGVWLIELAPLTDPRGVPQAVASVLGLREEAGQTLAQTLARHVRGQRVLFILDNCEHVIHAAAELAKQLLQAGPDVKVLATSRSALQVAGEASCPVPPLALPDPRRAVQPDELLRHEAVRLFIERASAAQPSFRLDAANAVAVADVCQRLDGIPLALELAAARTRVLSVQAISQRLADRFRLLQTSDQTVLPRQRTLRALIDWSHDLLSEPERLLFRRLAVFAGGWSLEAAEAVCAGDGIDALDVLDLQSRLVQESLVAMVAGGERYRMLDTVRAYAQEKLDADPDAGTASQRHLEWHLQLAETAFAQLGGSERGRWLARLDTERENFMTAHRASAALAGGDPLALRLVHALRPYFISRGSLTMGLAMALDTIGRPGLQANDEARCKALFGAGQLSWIMGRHAQAQGLLTDALSIAREIGAAPVVARVLQPLGMNSLALGDFGAARRWLGEAMVLARAQDNPRELLAAQNALAMLYRIEGRLDAAQPLAEEVVTLARRLGEPEALGIALLNLAMVSIGAGKLGGVAEMLLEVLRSAADTGSQPLLVGCHEVCAGYAAMLDQPAASARFYGSALALREDSALARDAVDEKFLTPLLQAAEHSLGRQAWSAAVSAGRAHAHGGLAVALGEWLNRPS